MSQENDSDMENVSCNSRRTFLATLGTLESKLAKFFFKKLGPKKTRRTIAVRSTMVGAIPISLHFELQKLELHILLFFQLLINFGRKKNPKELLLVRLPPWERLPSGERFCLLRTIVMQYQVVAHRRTMMTSAETNYWIHLRSRRPTQVSSNSIHFFPFLDPSLMSKCNKRVHIATHKTNKLQIASNWTMSWPHHSGIRLFIRIGFRWHQGFLRAFRDPFSAILVLLVLLVGLHLACTRVETWKEWMINNNKKTRLSGNAGSFRRASNQAQ